MLKKILNNFWILRSIIPTIYFNFHYLPLRQAIKLPIFLYKPKLLNISGAVKIEGKISTGMIQLGKNCIPLYPNTGIVFENLGGTIIFKGKCGIGNNSAISVGNKGNLIIGSNFNASTTLKLVCWHSIQFEDDVLCGWDCLFMDTDFHQLSYTDSTSKPKAIAPIHIGKNCWFALKCTVMKGTVLADNNVIAASSLLNKDYSDASYCLLAGQPAMIKKRNIYRNPLADKVEY